MDYATVFHSLFPMRNRLRSKPVVVWGTGDIEKWMVESLRAMGISPLFAIGATDEAAPFCGVPVRGTHRIGAEDMAGVQVLVSRESQEALIPQLTPRWGLETEAFVLLHNHWAEAPAQTLSPMPERFRSSPEKRKAFMESRKRSRTRRYAWAQAFTRFVFYVYFVCCRTGWQYGVRRRDKWSLMRRAFRNRPHFKSLSTPAQQLWLCHELFKVSVRVRGDVAECGCYDGASTAILSTACQLVGRKLYVCDSFEGLPEPEADEAVTLRTGKTFYHWKEGEFASPGGVEGVKQKVREFGTLAPCEFVKGYFCDTLPDLPTDSLVLVFEDADLKSSVVDCVKSLWPRLRFDCKFFSHEPWSIDIVSIFYDAEFWKTWLGCAAPGFYGGDMGGIRSLLVYFKMGYALKRDFEKIVKTGERVVISGSL